MKARTPRATLDRMDKAYVAEIERTCMGANNCWCKCARVMSAAHMPDEPRLAGARIQRHPVRAAMTWCMNVPLRRIVHRFMAKATSEVNPISMRP